MNWNLLTNVDWVTTSWSGGTTTQMAIAPEGASYGDRDFLWRLSSARVELEHSEFTPLPDYNRFITTLSGPLDMKIGAEARFTLRPLQIKAFDGGTPVESWGRCTDFNLMLRKEVCSGTLTALHSDGHEKQSWPETAWSASRRDLAVYCVSGEVMLPEFGVTARTGQLLLCREAKCVPTILELIQGDILFVDIAIR